MARQYVSYKDLSVGVPRWAILSFLWSRVYSAFRIQRVFRRHLARVHAARRLQRWWVRQSYVFE